MTNERALEVAGAAVSTGGATFVALARGTDMDQWLMWGLSTLVGVAAAYGAFRVTAEHRLTNVEAALKTAATLGDIAKVQGQIDILAADNMHRREVMDRMDKRIEAIAERLGVM